MIARIHVNRHHIAANAKDGGDRPVFTAKIGRLTRYAREVEFVGCSRLVYCPDDPLSCGAVAWIEADATDIRLIGECSFDEARKT